MTESISSKNSEGSGSVEPTQMEQFESLKLSTGASVSSLFTVSLPAGYCV